MIKASDLRIGNLICDADYIANPADYEEIKVGIINGDENTIDSLNSGTVSCDDLHGIPLTPEWLEKFGFVYAAPFYTKGIIALATNFYRDASGRYDGFVLKVQIEAKKKLFVIRYVHDLQNFYFRLMYGEELTIKETV